MKPAWRIAGAILLTLISVAYTYLVTWGLDEGVRTIGAKWAHLDWHLSCGAVFALPVLWALQLDLRHQAGQALGIVAICAITNPVVTFGPGLFLTFVPPFWVTGLVTSLFLLMSITLLAHHRLPPWWPLFWAALTGLLGGVFFEIARDHVHYKGCPSGGVCVPVEWVLPAYLVWQMGLVSAFAFIPVASKEDANPA